MKSTPAELFIFGMSTMTTFNPDWPVPIIDLQLCDGCGKCVQACPVHALTLIDGKAVVAAPQDCGYFGLCEISCPVGAISRLFLLVA
jgi:NAD-dependent dihydropyrimidine dehydrogenase PreA subunit